MYMIITYKNRLDNPFMHFLMIKCLTENYIDEILQSPLQDKTKQLLIEYCNDPTYIL